MAPSTPIASPSFRAARVPVLMLALACASAVGTHAESAFAQQASADDAEATAQFRRGRTLYDAHRYDEALAAFRASLEILPSPATRIYVARSLRHMPGHVAEAYGEYIASADEADRRAGDEPRYRPVAQAARNEARESLAEITLVTLVTTDLPTDAQISIDGTPLDADRVGHEFALEPGTHTIDASAAGRVRSHQQIELIAGNAARVPITLQPEAPAGPMGSILVPTGPVAPPPQPRITQSVPVVMPPPNNRAPIEPPPPNNLPGTTTPPGSALRSIGGVTIGLGALVFVGGAIAGGITLAEYNSLSRDCNSGLCPSTVMNAEARAARGRTAGIITTAGLASGGGLIVLGAILFAVGRSRARSAYETIGRIYVDPALGTAGFSGTF